ncbi:MAG: recombinase family protein [Azonexus sp.]
MRKRTTTTVRAAPALDCTALYMRVSTTGQAEEGYGLDAQRTRLEAQCIARGWTICPEHVYTDAGISGGSTGRPAYAAMLEAARAGQVQRIVALKLDRMARNVRDFLALVDELKALGVDLVLIDEAFDTSTAQGKFALTLFAAMAELERSTIKARVMSGKAEKARQGGYNGSACPLGYDYTGGAFVANDDAGTVRSIFARFLAGASLSQIAQLLRAEDAPTAKGGQWWPSTVRGVLLNGAYAGKAQWNKVEADNGAHEAIVEADTYKAALSRLEALRPGPCPAHEGLPHDDHARNGKRDQGDDDGE